VPGKEKPGKKRQERKKNKGEEKRKDCHLHWQYNFAAMNSVYRLKICGLGPETYLGYKTS